MVNLEVGNERAACGIDVVAEQFVDDGAQAAASVVAIVLSGEGGDKRLPGVQRRVLSAGDVDDVCDGGEGVVDGVVCG